MAGTGDDVGEGPVGLEPRGFVEPGAGAHVLVREGEHGPTQLLGDQRPEHRVTPGGPVDRGQAHDDTRRPADALQGAEGEALQSATLADGGDEHPLLGLLGDQPDAKWVRPHGAEIRHLLDLGVAEHCAVLGLDLDSHRPRCLRIRLRYPLHPAGRWPCSQPGSTPGAAGGPVGEPVRGRSPQKINRP